MGAAIGTETSLPSMLEDFIRVEVEAMAACQTAIPLLAGPDERALVVSLRQDHERRLGELRAMARSSGANIPEAGTIYEARTIGRIRLAHRRGGDGAVLDAVRRTTVEVAEAYARGLRNAALPRRARPFFDRAVADLKRRRSHLGDAARLAA